MADIDLRSDTVTRPTAAMRQAMAEAPVGDDVYGEDPTVRALEERVAELLGKERALFVPSGTMSNQLALMVHTRRGDEVIAGEGSHCICFESGAAAALSGVQFAIAGQGGLFDLAELEECVKPPAFYLPRSALVVVENTHNRGGGRVFPQAQLARVAARAKELELAVHLDGARLWNASAVNGLSLAELCAPVDTVSICFSKGLGAPVGSALVGPESFVAQALRCRRMLGGAMRQAGIIAAGALYAIEHHRARLAEDHDNARRLAEILREGGLNVLDVETNIVAFRVAPERETDILGEARRRGVLIGPIARGVLRAVTHLDVSRTDVERAGRELVGVIRGMT
jgi:threonine aldolase